MIAQTYFLARQARPMLSSVSIQGSQSSARAHNETDMGDSDHVPALQAIVSCLLGPRQSQSPPFLIHLSGTAIVSDYQSPTYLGKLNPKVWSDVNDLTTISTLPDSAPHRATEKLLFDTVRDHSDKVRIAIVCPPDIYGSGKGLAKTWSALVPMFIAEAKKLEDGSGRVFYHGDGANTRSWVHIDELMTLYLKLVEAAAEGGEGAEWNDKVCSPCGERPCRHHNNS